MDDDEVIISDTAFDVPTDNYEEFDQEIDPAKLGAKLVQTNSLKGTARQYQVYAKTHLLLNFTEKKKAEEKTFRVNLAWLRPEPEHNRIIIWKWLYASLTAAALTALSIFFLIEQTFKFEYCIVATTITLTASLICILIFFYQMHDEFIFKSQFGNAKLFLIENKKPTQQAFDYYFIGLQQSIDNAQAALSVSERLVGELKMCRRLRDEGIINDESYTIARTAIFKHDQYKT